MQWYVTCTDKFMSGWGKAKGKTVKVVVICDTYDEAEVVADNLNSRTDMINVRIGKTYPQRWVNASNVHMEVYNKENGHNFFMPGYFRKQR